MKARMAAENIYPLRSRLTSIPFYSRPDVTVFLALQALDVITTLIGLRLGAAEANLFVARLMHTGPVTGLLIAKALSILLILIAIWFERKRLILILNIWLAGLVTWNLVMILMQAASWRNQ
jgi:hypothetical protein